MVDQPSGYSNLMRRIRYSSNYLSPVQSVARETRIRMKHDTKADERSVGVTGLQLVDHSIRRIPYMANFLDYS